MQLTKAQVKAGRFWREWERNGRWVCGRCGKPEARPHEHAWLGVFERADCGGPGRDRRSEEGRREEAITAGMCGICKRLAEDPGR